MFQFPSFVCLIRLHEDTESGLGVLSQTPRHNRKNQTHGDIGPWVSSDDMGPRCQNNHDANSIKRERLIAGPLANCRGDLLDQLSMFVSTQPHHHFAPVLPGHCKSLLMSSHYHY